MSYFMIHKDNGLGDIIEVDGEGLLKRLADYSVLGQLLWKLRDDNEELVELKDGLAKVWRSRNQQKSYEQPPTQQRLMLPQPQYPTQDYLAQVELSFVMPVRIRCRGHSKAHVEETIHDVISGRTSRPPPDFHVQIRPEEISALMGKLETGDVTAIDEVNIIDIAPYYLLTDGRRR